MKTALTICFLSLSATLFAQQHVVTIDGSSTVYPVTALAGAAFEKKTKGAIKVDVNFSGTTGGFRKFVKGQIDISGASRPILTGEIEEAKANAITYIEIPIAFDALTIAVNSKNSWAQSIKLSELKKLWEPAAEGKITRWNQIRPEWPDAEIKLFGGGKDSGTTDYFSEVVVGKIGAIRHDYDGSEDHEKQAVGIAGDQNALGFLPFAYFSEDTSKERALAIERDYDPATGNSIKSSPVMPSNRALELGYYMPLGRPLFIYVNAKSLDKPDVVAFLEFFLTHAGEFVRKAKYLHLSTIAYQGAEKDLSTKNVGTRFGGKPAIGIAAHDLLTLPRE